MNLTFEISRAEQSKLAELAQRRAGRRFVPAWLAYVHWYVLWPVTIVGIGFWYESMEVVVVSFVAFWMISYGSNYLWRGLYERGLSGSEPDASAQWTVTVEDAGFLLSSRSSRHWYAWDDFLSVEKTKSYVFIHATGGEFVYVPNWAFASEEVGRKFIALVEARISDAHSRPIAS